MIKRLLATLAALGLAACSAHAQMLPREPTATGYLTNAAEEYWPANTDSTHPTSFCWQGKHLPIRADKGYISLGMQFRETYENYQAYHWGIGAEDPNGYLLHRLLTHADVQWNQHFRVFTEFQSSTISGRNGGPRPVQDVNKLVVNQLFGEASFAVSTKARLGIRLGKQALQYGQGSLLDVRDANVRRAFMGAKVFIASNNTRIDGFVVTGVKNNEGFFDDRPDRSQGLAGTWVTHTFRGFVNRLDAYYLFISREQARLNQLTGKEIRHTLGADIYYKQGNWSGYLEADVQRGHLADNTITAWKVSHAVDYRLPQAKFSPLLTFQGAICSGDADAHDNKLQTFNPIYPRAFYYGYIDNIGSANVILAHTKAEVNLTSKLNLGGGFYKFWRQSLADGIYASNGTFLLASQNDGRLIGNMYDVVVNYTFDNFVSAQLVNTYFKRGSFLTQESATTKDTYFIGAKLVVRL